MPRVNFSPSIIIFKYLGNSPVIIQPFFNDLSETNLLPLVSLYRSLLLLFCLSSDCSRMSLSWTDGPTILFSSSMKRTEMTRSCGCCWAYLLSSTDPYRIVSEEAQLGRVVMDLTRKMELFQTGRKEKLFYCKQKKKPQWCVWIHMPWSMYVRASVLSFPAGKVVIYHFVWQNVFTQQLGGLWMSGPTPTF